MFPIFLSKMDVNYPTLMSNSTAFHDFPNSHPTFKKKNLKNWLVETSHRSPMFTRTGSSRLGQELKGGLGNVDVEAYLFPYNGKIKVLSLKQTFLCEFDRILQEISLGYSQESCCFSKSGSSRSL